MKRHILSLIAIGLVITLGSSVAIAGNANDGATKKNTKVTALKKGEQTQGTFAYRFDTYNSYLGGGGDCSTTDPNCTANLNDELRDGSTPYFPKVNIPDVKKPEKTTTNTKASTKAEK